MIKTIVLVLHVLRAYFSPEPVEVSHFVCCKDGECKPSEDERCADGWILHECSDTEQCNEDGTACWFDCWLA